MFRDVFVDNTVGLYGGDPTPFVTWDSINISDFIGLEMERVDVVGQGFLGPNGDGTLAYYEAGARGIVIQGAAPGERFLWLRRVRAEACCGHGIYITGVDFLESSQLESFACRGFNVYLDGISKARMFSTYGRGANDLSTTVPGKVAASPNTGAVVVANSSDVEMHVVGGDAATRHGVELNSGAGVVEVGTSDLNSVCGYTLKNNSGGSISLGGTGSISSDGVVDGVRQP